MYIHFVLYFVLDSFTIPLSLILSFTLASMLMLLFYFIKFLHSFEHANRARHVIINIAYRRQLNRCCQTLLTFLLFLHKFMREKTQNNNERCKYIKRKSVQTFRRNKFVFKKNTTTERNNKLKTKQKKKQIIEFNR